VAAARVSGAQAARWLCQIAADAGLMGMERLIQR
jgi:hypothetical protein